MNRLVRPREELFKDEDKGGREMEDKLEIQDLQDQLKISTGYLLGITFLKDGILTHHFMTNNFPTGDVKISLVELVKLALPDHKIDIRKEKVKERKDEPKK